MSAVGAVVLSCLAGAVVADEAAFYTDTGILSVPSVVMDGSRRYRDVRIEVAGGGWRLLDALDSGPVPGVQTSFEGIEIESLGLVNDPDVARACALELRLRNTNPEPKVAHIIFDGLDGSGKRVAQSIAAFHAPAGSAPVVMVDMLVPLDDDGWPLSPTPTLSCAELDLASVMLDTGVGTGSFALTCDPASPSCNAMPVSSQRSPVDDEASLNAATGDLTLPSVVVDGAARYTDVGLRFQSGGGVTVTGATPGGTLDDTDTVELGGVRIGHGEPFNDPDKNNHCSLPIDVQNTNPTPRLLQVGYRLLDASDTLVAEAVSVELVMPGSSAVERVTANALERPASTHMGSPFPCAELGVARIEIGSSTCVLACDSLEGCAFGQVESHCAP